LINARRPAAVTTAASGLDVTLPTAAPLTVPIARVVARTTATPSPLRLGGIFITVTLPSHVIQFFKNRRLIT